MRRSTENYKRVLVSCSFIFCDGVNAKSLQFFMVIYGVGLTNHLASCILLHNPHFCVKLPKFYSSHVHALQSHGHCNLWSAQHEYILSVHVTIWWTGLQFVDSILQSNSKQQLMSAGVRVQNLFCKSFLDVSCHCWRRRENSVCLWIEPFSLPQFRMQNAKESWKLMMQQTWSQIVAMRLPSTPGPTTNKSFSLLLHVGSAQKSRTSATISKAKYLWNEDKKPVSTLEKVHICVCVCVWWASRNLHEARTRLKLLLFKSKKDFQKKDFQNQEERNNMNGTKQKWERNTHLQYDQQQQPFTWFRDHQQQ